MRIVMGGPGLPLRCRSTEVRVLLWGCVAVLLGCPEPTAVWLADGATTANPVLAFGKESGKSQPIGLAFLRLDPCAALEQGRYPPAEEAAWFIESISERVDVERLTYGVLPDGFREVAASMSLQIGSCYTVTINGTGSLRFRVNPDGLLQEVER